jgi:hypothetical protein
MQYASACGLLNGDCLYIQCCMALHLARQYRSMLAYVNPCCAVPCCFVLCVAGAVMAAQAPWLQ